MPEDLRGMLQESLEATIGALEKEDNFSGVVLVCDATETVFSGAWGLASRTWKVANTLENLFHVASITKMFTATAVLQFVEAGQLALDQPVGSILTLRDTKISRQVTIRHLLTHTSGIADYFDEENEGTDALPKVFETTPLHCVRHLSDFLPLFSSGGAYFAPGDRFQYCNAGFILLGLVVERITGQEYFGVIGNKVFVPSGMTKSRFCNSDSICENLSDGYVISCVGEDERNWQRNVSRMLPPAADGGAVASAVELIRFMQALRGGCLLGQETAQAMCSQQVDAGDGWGYGFGVWVQHKKDELVRYGHTGEDPGISARLWHYPASNVDVVILCNMSQVAGYVSRTIHELIAV